MSMVAGLLSSCCQPVNGVPVYFHTLPFEEAMRSIELFASEVMPHFAQTPALA